MSTTTIPTSSSVAASFSGDADHSSFGFAVKHMSVSTFRGAFEDVTAAVEVDEHGAIGVAGSARVESISVRSPVDLRVHLLSRDFFDAAQSPEITFRSRPAVPAADGAIELQGELTIRNVTRAVVARGTWTGPVEDPFGATRAALELSTTIDRRDYGMTWNLPLPKGGDALGNEVAITVHLELVAS
ncbi:MAG TPA: YceI family protein [Solirubrobacteraceae bacterium]|jgi:polyisoprenoid-binding protein YceI